MSSSLAGEIKYYGFIILIRLAFEMQMNIIPCNVVLLKGFCTAHSKRKMADGEHLIKRQWRSTVNGGLLTEVNIP